MVIYAEWARFIWVRLLWIDSNDLKVDVAAKREQRVVRSYAGMRASRRCPDSGQGLHIVHSCLEVLTCQRKMVESCHINQRIPSVDLLMGPVSTPENAFPKRR